MCGRLILGILSNVKSLLRATLMICLHSRRERYRKVNTKEPILSLSHGTIDLLYPSMFENQVFEVEPGGAT